MKGLINIKKIIISVIALAMGLALIISVSIPILSYVRETGNSAFQKGKTISPFVEQILK